MSDQLIEPKEAFPYKPPSNHILEKYSHIFEIKEFLPNRRLKLIFDKSLSFTLLFVGGPILIFLKIAYLIEGFIIPENKGPLLFSYKAVSAGIPFPKYKIRIIKESAIDSEAAAREEWIAYAGEWNPVNRTYVGSFVKKYYLDEIPQLFNILNGQMSIVGPRPLSVLHYKRDLEQGNVTRKLLKGGLLGLGHIMKGKPDFGNPIYEYEYINRYLKSSNFGLLLLDIKIIYRGIIVVIKGKGL